MGCPWVSNKYNPIDIKNSTDIGFDLFILDSDQAWVLIQFFIEQTVS